MPGLFKTGVNLFCNLSISLKLIESPNQLLQHTKAVPRQKDDKAFFKLIIHSISLDFSSRISNSPSQGIVDLQISGLVSPFPASIICW